jgi:hypothetical protein
MFGLARGKFGANLIACNSKHNHAHEGTVFSVMAGLAA